MKQADAFLVLLTPRFFDSRWPLHELNIAFSIRHDPPEIIPVVAGPVDLERIPPLLQNLKWVDLTGDFDTGVALIVRALESREKPAQREDSGVLLSKLRWIELVIGLLLAALITVIGYGSVTDLSFMLPVIMFAGGLGGLTAVIASINDRRTRSPIELVKRNIVAAFVNALDESSLNPLREESRNVKTR